MSNKYVVALYMRHLECTIVVAIGVILLILHDHVTNNSWITFSITASRWYQKLDSHAGWHGSKVGHLATMNLLLDLLCLIVLLVLTVDIDEAFNVVFAVTLWCASGKSTLAETDLSILFDVLVLVLQAALNLFAGTWTSYENSLTGCA